ncbi:hypothetical protein GGX14DRAFT_395724 [Mycena pura]|uniref:Uncharacterized protein n=1 Tax=Mycena pura TaxID=153505 RepID=A0AAD6VJ94_9AGAR|nr:hypothetical protein GGX14DRAFT_395724 [Mycena pura]
MNVAGWVELVVVLDVQTVLPTITDPGSPEISITHDGPHVARAALLVVADDLGDFGLKNHKKIPVHTPLCTALHISCAGQLPQWSGTGDYIRCDMLGTPVPTTDVLRLAAGIIASMLHIAARPAAAVNAGELRIDLKDFFCSKFTKK